VRSYGQFCGVAKALDIVGDRWSLLIIRELMLLGPCRYTDLQRGLPGIATNLLADRLRWLEESGVVRRDAAAPPIATTLFSLTERGQELLPVLRELGRWGAPLLADQTGDDAFCSYWIALPLDLYYHDPTPELAPVTIEVRMGDEPMTIQTFEGKVRALRGPADHPDAMLTGPPRLVIGVLSGNLSLVDACNDGLILAGQADAVSRIRPRPAPTSESSSASG